MTLTSFAPQMLQQLRAAVLAAPDGLGVRRLQEAGYATGEALFAALEAALAARGEAAPATLAPDAFGDRLAGFLEEHGWGEAGLEFAGGAEDDAAGPRALLLTLDHGPEAVGAGTAADGSPFTTGVLSGLLTRVAGAPVAVLAVEAALPEAPLRIRFLAASPETATAAWQAMSAGGNWRNALA